MTDDLRLDDLLGELYSTTEYGQPCENCGEPVPDDTPRRMNLGVAQDGKYCELVCRLEAEDGENE
jgi:hypothetical protein